MKKKPLKDNPNALFSWSDIAMIRAQYRLAPTPATIKRLAVAYIVTPGTIRNIVTGKTWKASFKKERAA